MTLGDENDSADELERNSDVSPEIIQLSFKLSRSKAPISVRVLKSHTFEQIKIMLEGATSTKIKSFRFDGDLIELNQTPTDLDLEDDDQIDTKLHEQ